MLNPPKRWLLRGMNQAFRLGFPGRITLSNMAYQALKPEPSALRVRESGFTLEVDLANQELRYIFARAYERAEAQFIRDTLRPGDVCVDVGANIGFLAVIAASVVAPTGKVFALEPDPRTFEALKVCAEDSRGLIQAYPLAAGDGSSDKVSFYLAPTEHAMWSSTTPKAGRQQVEVDCVSLSEFIRREDIEPAFIKIDVEGTEAAVLRGLLPYVKTAFKPPTILVELNPKAHAKQELSTWQLCEPFVSAGYRMRSWEQGRLRDVDRAWIEARPATFNLVLSES
jgi:FkbM family methyltransferase